MQLEHQRRNIAILGSTGSIGTQALEVIDGHPDAFSVEVLTANNNVDLLIAQALKYRPNAAVIANENLYTTLSEALNQTDVKVYAGKKAIASVVEMEQIDVVVSALVGFSGLESTVRAVEYGKQIALANKETLVVAGDIITGLAREKGVNIYPVDSEHSAIFQCLTGEFHNKIEKIILTASGGPFRGRRREDLVNVAAKEALKHPNWDMGAKVTIDSSTLANKGLEVIEAKWLFNLSPSQIEVIVHPQSIIHSMVQFEDGSIKAQMGLPDMKLPIQYAISYPNRLNTEFPRFNFADYPSLTFEQPDTDTFRNLALSYEALRKGGNSPCVMNAANEIAVQEFLKGNLGFLEMSDVIERCMVSMPFIEKPKLEDYFETDKETRIKAFEFIS
jgi:1-deoxy-D-xylulose-5-phosphate reductoisomerase